jgi:hypothetical protein
MEDEKVILKQYLSCIDDTKGFGKVQEVIRYSLGIAPILLNWLGLCPGVEGFR